MAGLTDYVAKKLADHLFSKASYTAPTIYVGLFTAAPTDAGGGTEVTGGSYARVSTVAGDWNAATSTGTITNANPITFPTATVAWGTVTHFGLFDSSSGVNLLGWAALTSSKVVDVDDDVKFNASQLTVNMNAN